MSAIGSLVFCTDCGNLLESSAGNKNAILVCDCCGAENQGLSDSACLWCWKYSSCYRHCFQDDHNADKGVFLSLPLETKAIGYSTSWTRGYGKYYSHPNDVFRMREAGSQVYSGATKKCRRRQHNFLYLWLRS